MAVADLVCGVDGSGFMVPVAKLQSFSSSGLTWFVLGRSSRVKRLIGARLG